MTKTERIARLFVQLDRIGIDVHDGLKLLKCANTLQRWHELECGNGNARCSWFIEYVDDDRDRPELVTIDNRTGERTARKLPNRRAKATATATAIATAANCGIRVQGDPRGCALYVFPLDDPKREIAVCVD